MRDQDLAHRLTVLETRYEDHIRIDRARCRVFLILLGAVAAAVVGPVVSFISRVVAGVP